VSICLVNFVVSAGQETTGGGGTEQIGQLLAPFGQMLLQAGGFDAPLVHD